MVARPANSYDSAAADAFEALHRLEVSLQQYPILLEQDATYHEWVAATRELLQQCALLPWGAEEAP